MRSHMVASGLALLVGLCLPAARANAADGGGDLSRLPAKAQQKLLQKFDADGNGKLEGAELEKAKAAIAEHRAKRGKQGGGKGAGKARVENAKFIKKFDTDGDGKLNDTEHAAARKAREEKRKARIAKFDTDGNGKLEGAELEAAKAARDKHRAEARARTKARKGTK